MFGDQTVNAPELKVEILIGKKIVPFSGKRLKICKYI